METREVVPPPGDVVVLPDCRGPMQQDKRPHTRRFGGLSGAFVVFLCRIYIVFFAREMGGDAVDQVTTMVQDRGGLRMDPLRVE